MRCACERLKETAGSAFGFKVTGKLSDEELKAFEPQMEFFITQHKKHPIGILADLTDMRGAEWKARWDDLRFLQKHTSQIARMSVVGASRWEEVADILTAGAAVLQSETRPSASSRRRPESGKTTVLSSRVCNQACNQKERAHAGIQFRTPWLKTTTLVEPGHRKHSSRCESNA